MATRLNHENILLLEQPLIKVPTDALRTSFRTTQRNLEGGLGGLKGPISDLSSKTHQWQNAGTLESEVAKEEALRAIDQMLNKARGARKKIEDARSNPQIGSAASIARIEARLAHLQDLHDAEVPTDDKYRQFSAVRLERQLVDYMLRNGNIKSAMALSAAQGIEPLVDAPLFAEAERIERALRAHSCTEALLWCKENASALKKLESTLEFELRYQEYVELARARRGTEAIQYCRKQLVPWQDQQLPQIKQAMALLAFDPSTTCPPYAALYNVSRWDRLLTSFRSTLFALHAIPAQPFLHLSLSVGLSSLKLSACYGSRSATGDATQEEIEEEDDTDEDELDMEDVDMMAASSATLSGAARGSGTTRLRPGSTRNADCPTCDQSGLGVLAKECPWSHHVNSTIICQMTGKVVEDGEGLMALPNGRVYSREGLEAMAMKQDGKVTCPRTGETFAMDQARRVFIS